MSRFSKQLGAAVNMDGEEPEFFFVQTDDALMKTADLLNQEAVIAVDLEADSMYHYREKVCLIQFSTPSTNILVDPLAVKDLSSLKPVFRNPRITKVLHGADYDIRSLYRDFKIEIKALFDTLIAARFLGLKEFGLAGLLKERLGISLKKKYQKKDWSQRPLPAPMLAYAVHDTCHLLDLADNLKRPLQEMGRLPFVKEECQIQTMVRAQEPDQNPLFLRFSGAGRLDRRSLAVLEGILQFRDQIARKRDVPHFKVMGNSQVMALARQRPLLIEDLRNIKGFSHRQVKQFGPALLKVLKTAVTLPDDQLPVYPRKTLEPVSPLVGERVKRLKKWRDQMGSRMGLDPALICTNAQARSLAVSNPEIPEDIETVLGIKTWQREQFGSDICGVLKEPRF